MKKIIIIFLILGSITTVGYWYYNTFMEYGAFGISGIYPCVYDNKTEIIICSVKEK